MTRAEQIVSLASEGLDNGQIASRIGCRREYVRVAKRRARLEVAKPKGQTLQHRIEALYADGLSDTEISARLGCTMPYVRVARQRAGLFRGRPSAPKINRIEQRILQRIDRLQVQLAAARDELRLYRGAQTADA